MAPFIIMSLNFSIPDLPNPMAELSWIRYAHTRPKTRPTSLVGKAELTILATFTLLASTMAS
jgi:hypothetical protein